MNKPLSINGIGTRMPLNQITLAIVFSSATHSGNIKILYQLVNNVFNVVCLDVGICSVEERRHLRVWLQVHHSKVQ